MIGHYLAKLYSLILESKSSIWAGIAMQILLYADDIVLIFDNLEGLQRHLNALKLFCTDKGLSINMDKIE